MILIRGIEIRLFSIPLILKRYFPLLLVAIYLCVWNTQNSQSQLIQTCTETAFDAALAAAKDGDSLTFACDASIVFTNPKSINQNIRIQGKHQRITSTYHGSKALISVVTGTVVFVDNLIFENTEPIGGWLQNEGILNISNCIFRQSTAAIHNTQGILTIQDSLIEHNIHGIRNYGGSVFISRVMFRNNEGTAVYNSKSASILDSTFIGNGHGVDNGGGIVIVTGSTFYNNEVHHLSTVGAGIASSGKAYIIDSMFIDNTALRGAGIFNRSNGYLLIVRTVIANNQRGNCRGNIWDGGGNAQYPNKTCGKSIKIESRLKDIHLVWAANE